MPTYCIFQKEVKGNNKFKAHKMLVVKRYRFEYPRRGEKITRDTTTKITSMKLLGKIEAPTKKDALRKAIWQGML